MSYTKTFFIGITGIALGLGLMTPAFAGPAIPGPVSASPAGWTPHLPATSSTTMQVRQLAQCGGTMYAVGTFTTFKRYSLTVTRNNAVSFSATTGTISTWDPNVNGTVNSIALSADCSTAYLR